MPVGIENKDSTFFSVESPDVSLSNENFNRFIVSLSIVERMDGLPQGSLQFYDPKHYFSRILRTGAALNISWGYRDIGVTPDSWIAQQINADEVTGSMIRRGYQGFVSSPNGSGGSDGTVMYNCSFTGHGFRGIVESKEYKSGTKKDVIAQAFDELGISSAMRMIDFELGNDAVTEDKTVRQDESTYAFIARMAKEWGQALFMVGFAPNGDTVGMFVDASKLGTVPLSQWMLGASGFSNIIGYKGELSNVIQYKWTSSEGENGVGDNVRLDIVDGKIIYRQYVAEDETVVSWRLDSKKIQEVYQDASAGGLAEQVKLTQDLLSKQDFEQVKHFFIRDETTTAPQGYGYRITADMIGNPLYIPGTVIKINNGFPDRLGNSDTKWYIQSVTHKIDRSGYKMTVEIVDVFNLSPTGQAVL